MFTPFVPTELSPSAAALQPTVAGFEAAVKAHVRITIDQARLLKTCSESHYDSVCRHSGERGAINGLANSTRYYMTEEERAAIPADQWWTSALDVYDCGIICKVLENQGGVPAGLEDLWFPLRKFFTDLYRHLDSENLRFRKAGRATP